MRITPAAPAAAKAVPAQAGSDSATEIVCTALALALLVLACRTAIVWWWVRPFPDCSPMKARFGRSTDPWSAAQAFSFMILDVSRLLLFPALMAFAAASDLFTMTISNRVSLALAAGFLALAILSGMGLSEILSHLGAGAAVLAVSFACFTMGWVGGGDAKLVAGAALWFGFSHLLDYLVYASLFGGALTLLLLQFRQWPLPYPLAGQAWLLKLHAKESGIPYGIALAIGALVVYPETEWIRAVDLSHFVIR
jgi:prepilin peptidase CpaA